MELDENRYSGQDAMIVKIPLTMPYQTNFNAYERVDGEFESEGHFYKIFQQKLVNDTLYVVFVENKRSGELHKSVADFAASNSPQAPVSNTAAKLIVSFCKDFAATNISVLTCAEGWNLNLNTGNEIARIIVLDRKPFSPPPERI